MSITIDFTAGLTATAPKTAETMVEIYDPPMCCPTGLCGPTLDQTLLDVSDMIHTLEAAGVIVERYQMTTNPQKFMANMEIMRLVREQQMAALPITAVNSQVIKVGAYPTLSEVQTYLS